MPVGLEEFYAQKVSWESCTAFTTPKQDLHSIQEVVDRGLLPALESETKISGLAKTWEGISFTCAYVIVPVDYSNPTGPTAAIAVSRASTGLTKDGTPKQGLFGNAGGPGQPSLPFAVDWAVQFRDVLTDYDIIAPDTRGAGVSLPQIRCATDKFFQAQTEGADGLRSTPEGLVRLDQINKANTDACYANTGAGFVNADGTPFSAETYIPEVSVDDEARDMDVIRSVIGNEKLSYQGGSDGTGVGYTYAQEFPNNTRAMVLDSPINPFANNPAEAAKFEDITGHAQVDPYEQLKGFQDTFYQFAETCAREDGFTFGGKKVPCALGTDADRATLLAAYQAIAQKAFGGTTYGSASQNRPLSFADFAQATKSAMYAKGLWAQLNAGLSQAKAGDDVGDLLALRDAYYRYKDGTYPFFVAATFPTIHCQNFDDDGAVTSVGSYEAAPFTDPGKDTASGSQRDGLTSAKGGSCDFYRSKNQKALAEPVSALPNILVVASSHDPATPYVGGVLMAKGLSATLLTVENPQHIAVGQVDCATSTAVAYLKTLAVPTDIRGRTGIPVLDLTQRPLDPAANKNVTGDECRVDSSNRPEPTVATANGRPGDTVEVAMSGLVRASGYTVAVTAVDGTPLAGAEQTVDAGDDGRAKARIPIPADSAVGDYVIKVTGDDDVNQSITVPSGRLIIQTSEVPTVSLAQATVVAGTPQTISGAGFPAGARISLTLHSTPVDLGAVTADAQGAFMTSFTIPADLEAGAHTITAATGNVVVSASFTVTAAAGSASAPHRGGGASADKAETLAATGADAPLALALLAILLIAASALIRTVCHRTKTYR